MSTAQPQHRLIILLFEHSLVCLKYDALKGWRVQPIKGEAVSHLKAGKPSHIDVILGELSERLNQEQALEQVLVYLLYDWEGADLLASVPVKLAELQCRTWQILRLEPMLERALQRAEQPEGWNLTNIDDHLSANGQWFWENLMPAVISVLEDMGGSVTDTPEKQQPSSDATELCAGLKARLLRLEKEKALLESQMRHVVPDGGERLLAFLPALYKQVFSVLSGADLAILIGRVEPFDIPSPYPELTGDPLRRKQREFMALPQAEQRLIFGFSQGLSQRLELRPEMRAHVETLEAP